MKNQTQLLQLPEIELWPDPIKGELLLNGLLAIINRFVVLPKWAGETLALWTLHTYAFHLRDVSTYLGIESREKRCGKTTLLTVLSELVNRPVVSSNISSPAFFRVIEETLPTLLIDEADTFLQANDELRGILNSGYTRKTAFAVRVAQSSAAPSVSLERSPLFAAPIFIARYRQPDKLQEPSLKLAAVHRYEFPSDPPTETYRNLQKPNSNLPVHLQLLKSQISNPRFPSHGPAPPVRPYSTQFDPNPTSFLPHHPNVSHWQPLPLWSHV
jgi:hypothetical protein